MHYKLDPIAKPYENLCDVFREVRSNRDHHEEYQDSQGNANVLRQHRMTVSPTLIKLSTG